MHRDRFGPVWVLVVVAVLALAGCGREAPATTPAAGVPTAVAGSETPSAGASEATEPGDEYAVPDQIDAAYVEKVLEALSSSVADAAREIVARGNVSAQAKAILASTHRAGTSLDGVLASFERAIDRERPADVFNPEARRIDIEVEKIYTAEADCIFTRVQQDTSDLVGEDIDPVTGYIHIESKSGDEDPEGRNPTPWMIVAEVGDPPKGQEYDDPCG